MNDIRQQCCSYLDELSATLSETELVAAGPRLELKFGLPAKEAGNIVWDWLDEREAADEVDAEIDEEIAVQMSHDEIDKYIDEIIVLDNLDHKQARLRKQQRAYREAHKDELAEKQRAYREAHKDELAEYKRAYMRDYRKGIRRRQHEIASAISQEATSP